MPKLKLGENEANYTYGNTNRTTVQVGKILEKRYELFSTFLEVCGQDISDGLAEGMAKRIDALIEGKAKSPENPYAGLGLSVEKRFRKFLNTYEAERVGIPGTPTKAAKKGINHRGKANYRRPSFIDSALLRDNFRAWVED